jgi:bifunctional DNase/RNase
MEKIRLKIIGMSYSQSQSGAYALIMGEVNGNRRLPIIIGGFEAQAIAIELEKMKPSRPLTHDLFKSFAKAFNVNLKEVIINKFQEGVFHAKLICDYEGGELEIDSRTSDAVALALRFHCPIYTYETIMASAGIEMDQVQLDDDATGSEIVEEDSSYGQYSMDELNDLLQKAIESEEYEKASLIRDELKKRKG